MKRAAPVTSDLTVLTAIDKLNKAEGDGSQEFSWQSAVIAEALQLTPFQVTARLKAMEGRSLLARTDGCWYITDKGHRYLANPPAPKPERPLGERVYRTPSGGLYSPGAAQEALAALDEGVPHQQGAPGWRMRYRWTNRVQIGSIIVAKTRTTIFKDLDGQEWVKCRPTEKAELIVDSGPLTAGLSSMRLRRYFKKQSKPSKQESHQLISETQ